MNPTKNTTNIFEKLDINYSRSKEDVWENISKKINSDSKPKKNKPIIIKLITLSSAAIITILITFGIVAYAFNKTIECPNGKHIKFSFADGTTIQMNAHSQIKYYPLLWPFIRKIELQGEAFFKVSKGNTFSVYSKNGKVTVLGTSFNIFARDEYKVVCLTGKVKVEINKVNHMILKPNQLVKYNNGKIIKAKNINVTQNTAWITNKFVFTAESLRNVFNELQRQYDIKIYMDNNINGEFTGSIQRQSLPINTLNIICKPFGFNVKKINNSTFKITK